MIIKMNNKYMVVISLDAVSSKDIEIMKELPNISKLMKEGVSYKECRNNISFFDISSSCIHYYWEISS